MSTEVSTGISVITITEGMSREILVTQKKNGVDNIFAVKRFPDGNYFHYDSKEASWILVRENPGLIKAAENALKTNKTEVRATAITNVVAKASTSALVEQLLSPIGSNCSRWETATSNKSSRTEEEAGRKATRTPSSGRRRRRRFCGRRGR